ILGNFEGSRARLPDEKKHAKKGRHTIMTRWFRAAFCLLSTSESDLLIVGAWDGRMNVLLGLSEGYKKAEQATASSLLPIVGNKFAIDMQGQCGVGIGKMADYSSNMSRASKSLDIGFSARHQ